MKKELDVVAALIKEKGKILLCQRKADDTFALLWEFPGGCVEKEEFLPEAIKREIKEELDLEIEVTEFVEKFEDQNDILKIYVYLYLCKKVSGEIKAKDCNDFGFYTLNEVNNKELAPVDRKIYAFLTRYFSN